MKMTEKAAYLKGLADGLDYDKTTKEGKLIAALIDLADELAGTVAEQQKEIVQKYDGAVKILGELTDDMPTATVVRGESLSLYLAPFYDLRTVRIFRSDLTEWVEAGTDNPLDHISGWEAGEYYAVITAVYLGTGESEISEFPVRVCLVEPKE